MVKSTLVEVEVPVEEPFKYPILARHSHTREVVFFSSSSVGTVVWQPLNSALKRLGLNFDDWYDLEKHQDYWEILPKGTRIELIQE